MEGEAKGGSAAGPNTRLASTAVERQVTASVHSPVRSHCGLVGGVDWSGCVSVRHAYYATDEGNTDLQTNKNLRAVQLLLGHTKLESTVRYLGIEVDDALEIAEQTEVQHFGR